MAMAMRQLLLLAMVLRAHACKVVGRSDRLCSESVDGGVGIHGLKD